MSIEVGQIPATNVETLAGLTLKQETFAHAWARSRNNTVAYKAAYDWKGMTDKSIWEEACRVRNNIKVTARILDLLQEQADHAELTDEWILDRLMTEVQHCDQPGARATNLKTLAQTRAMLVQRNINEETKSDAEAVLELVSADYAQPPKDCSELKEPDMKLYKALMGKLGN